jgi:predicted lactoylglutathione lyase
MSIRASSKAGWRLASRENRRKAVAAGGTTYNEPQDRGFMYAHGYQDLDGRIWELVYMGPGAVDQN